MAYEIAELTVDLLSDGAKVVLQDGAVGRTVIVMVKIQTPGNQPENQLKTIAKQAAKQALQDAANAL